MLAFTHLPPELISNVLSFVGLKDLAQVNLTCKYLYHTVQDNTALFRALYLRHFDDPGTAQLDWPQEIHHLVKLKAICRRRLPDKHHPPPHEHLRFVYETTTRLLFRSSAQEGRSRRSISYCASRNTHFLRQCFASPSAIDAFLCGSHLFHRAKAFTREFPFANKPPSEARQMSAKLHCLYGDMVLHWSRTRASRTYPFAASKVYDIRECTPRTRWGPFRDEGPGPKGSPDNKEGEAGLPTDRVDWEKVEAIMIVLWHNMKNKELDRLPVFEQFWGVPFAGCWPNSYIPMPVNRELFDIERDDPYDVTGTWLRVVCFLDYNDFFTYNFPPHDALPAHLPRPVLDEIEATRLIIMKIHVTKIEPPGPEDGQALPVVHFEGLSRSLDSSWDDNANSDLRGSVRLTREGEVRWTSHSIFQGEARWRSECVQLGGIRASKVVGNWFDKDYDPSGPCGPTAYWKIGDRHQGAPDNRITVHDYLPIVDGYEDETHIHYAHPRLGNHNGHLMPFQIHSDDDDDDDDHDHDHEQDDAEVDESESSSDNNEGDSDASTMKNEEEEQEQEEEQKDADDAGEGASENVGVDGEEEKSGTSKLLAAELEDDDNDNDPLYTPPKARDPGGVQ